jgi:hypothetical protein
MSASGYWLIGEIDDMAASSLAPSFERWRVQVEADPGFRRCRSVWSATDDVLAHVTRAQSGDRSVLDLDDRAMAIAELFAAHQPPNALFLECADLVATDDIWDLRRDRPSEPTTAMIGTRKLAPLSLVFVALGPVASEEIPGVLGNFALTSTQVAEHAHAVAEVLGSDGEELVQRAEVWMETGDEPLLDPTALLAVLPIMFQQARETGRGIVSVPATF